MENIQVCLRIRPLNRKEKDKGEMNIWRIYEGVSLMLRKNTLQYLPLKKNTMQNMVFNYDRCFQGNTTNESIYGETIQTLVSSCLKGINATTFMYGQTGSGKTYTMLGYDTKMGLYNKLKNHKKQLRGG